MVLEPRKSPVQARSAASVDAILEATIQVLLGIGKERLTTTTVAMRAGVSVGTLYQYFPNKSALLQAVLSRHMNDVAERVEMACAAQHGKPVEAMSEPLVTEFLKAKMHDVRASCAMYAVSNDVDGATIAKQTGVRILRALVAMLKAARDPLKNPDLAASMVQGAMAGVSRRLLDSDDPQRMLGPMQTELIVFVGRYLESCVGPH